MLKTKLLLLFFLLSLPLAVLNAKDDAPNAFTYDIKCGGSGTQGYYIVEVSAYVNKKNQIGQEIVRKCAVHGVLFKGFNGGQGCSSQRPLVANAMIETQKSEFFQPFFEEGGGYGTYATMVNGSIQTQKVGKQFKVTAIVSVAKDQLRKDLEQVGIIKGLGAGF